MSTPSLLDAIRIVKENERNASLSYKEAGERLNNPSARQLFEELAKFEQFHFEQLTALETSLENTGEYINYEGKEFPTPPVFEIKAAQEPNMKSVMKIIAEAMELEKEAEKVYADLALQSEDSQGYEMFLRLSAEENIHWRILLNAYWTLTNLGTWTWHKL
ncbi:MAG: ferritin family protein [Chloroflexi bacterium]|nr:ferritin family protein [Chloroflexota bacterium]